jgi:hypothetical protein
MPEIPWNVQIGEPGWSDGLEPYTAFRDKNKKSKSRKPSVGKRASPPPNTPYSMTMQRPIGGKSVGGKGRSQPIRFRGRGL